jgi:hypothetical protein
VVYYLSDTAASEFKNRKYFISLYYYKDNCGMVTKWLFCAESHGSGSYDGVGENN